MSGDVIGPESQSPVPLEQESLEYWRERALRNETDLVAAQETILALQGQLTERQEEIMFLREDRDSVYAHALEIGSRIISAGAELEQLRASEAELRERAIRDPLTGLYNRYPAYELYARLWSVGRRSQFPKDPHTSILVIDLDHFKEFNDSHGHAEGDTTLKDAAQILTGCLRDIDVAIRWGGEEFVVLLAGTDESAAKKVADKIRTAIKQGVATTASIGIVEAFEGESLDDAFNRGDQALYAAKHQGRDRTVVFSELPPPNLPEI